MNRPVYLDYNATAPLKPPVILAVSAALAEVGNASSVHRWGRLARRRVETAREAVAGLLGAGPQQIVFTSGGTEANNLALAAGGRRLMVAATEHDSVLRAAPDAEIVPVDRRGIIDLAALDKSLARDSRPALVAVMLANNETGVVQPLAEVVRLAHARGALVHCDAAQAVGKVDVDMQALGVDMLTVSAHKFGGPQGVGAVVVADHVELSPLLRGGGQERGRRAGTENVAAIAGFGAAARLAAEEMPTMARLAGLRDGLEARLRRQVSELVTFGADADRLPNTSCLAMPNVSAETQVMAFDLAGIAVSAGSACSSGKVRSSHVLAAMGVPSALAGSAIRVSLGWATSEADLDRFVETWTQLWFRLGAGKTQRAAPAA
ncbi:MAG: cysteine desulfurase [Proteobacteria bacterium]|nr:cysteine desulfurase [Pseudomonadota bacterium]